MEKGMDMGMGKKERMDGILLLCLAASSSVLLLHPNLIDLDMLIEKYCGHHRSLIRCDSIRFSMTDSLLRERAPTRPCVTSDWKWASLGKKLGGGASASASASVNFSVPGKPCVRSFFFFFFFFSWNDVTDRRMNTREREKSKESVVEGWDGMDRWINGKRTERYYWSKQHHINSCSRDLFIQRATV